MLSGGGGWFPLPSFACCFSPPPPSMHHFSPKRDGGRERERAVEKVGPPADITAIPFPPSPSSDMLLLRTYVRPPPYCTTVQLFLFFRRRMLLCSSSFFLAVLSSPPCPCFLAGRSGDAPLFVPSPSPLPSACRLSGYVT